MADYNPNISNGTCYYADGEESPSRFIPCGNDAGGHVSCCESGDMCLSSRACYNGQYGVTYLAGCTDPVYEDGSCPEKAYQDQVWAGLVYCNGTSDEWVACPDQATTVSSPVPCWCPSTSRTVAFTDASVLTNIMQLPSSLRESVTWQSGFGSSLTTTTTESTAEASTTSESSPTTDGSESSTSLSASPGGSGGTATAPANTISSIVQAPSAATATHSTAPTVSGLSTGAKAGVGVGVAVGAIAILVLAWVLRRYFRHRKQKQMLTPPMEELIRPPSQISPDDPDMRSLVWAGHKSELPANEVTSMSPTPKYEAFRHQHVSEVEGSPARGGSARPLRDGGYEMPGQQGTVYEMAG